jgi:AcrR family transcriptional regulator
MPKIIDHEEMREDLLQRSFGLFARKGFHAVTMRDLARELQVSTGTLYHYFSNKNDLYAQMLRTLVDRDVRRVLGDINDRMAPGERLQVLLRYVGEKEEHFKGLLFLLFDFYRFRGTLEENAEMDPEAVRTSHFFQELLTTYRETIAENVGLANRQVGQLITSVIIGNLVQRIVDPARMSLTELQEAFDTILPEPEKA